jgi:hypothetical protein
VFNTHRAVAAKEGLLLTWLMALIRQIQADQSEVYGEGFRKCAAAIGAFGLDIFLEHIQHSDEFPVV